MAKSMGSVGMPVRDRCAVPPLKSAPLFGGTDMGASAPAPKYEWWSGERALRIVVTIAGGWLFIDMMVAALSLAAVLTFGMQNREAVVLFPSLGFLAYFGVLTWGFAAHSVKRVCVVLLGGSALFYGIARVLMQFMPLPGGN